MVQKPEAVYRLPAPTTYRPDIDGLRAISVLAVIFFHAGIYPFRGGYVGVDVFFVISGYLITSLIVREDDAHKFSLKSFYERRIRRIFPALFAVILATTIGAAIILVPHALKKYAASAIAASLFSSNFLFWKEVNYFDNLFQNELLLHTWSLAIEEQFYVLYPLLLLFARRQFPALSAWFFGAILIASLATSVIGVIWFPEAAFYLLPSRIWELLLGAMLGLCSLPVFTNAVRNAMALAGLTFIAVPVFCYSSTTAFPGMAALAPCLGAAMIIQSGIGGLPFTNRVLATRPFVFTGLISYSLYLWHWPILALLGQLLVRDMTATETFIALTAIAILSILSWRFVELPFRRTGNGFSQVQIFRDGILAMALTLFVGIFIFLGNGFPQRLTPTENVFANGALDFDSDRGPCLLASDDDARRGHLCPLGVVNGPPSFLLWGDSHAEVLRPALDRAAKSRGASGLFAGWTGCPPQGKDFGPVALIASCEKSNAATMAFLRDHPEIGTVLLAAYWAPTADGGTGSGKAIARRQFFGNAGESATAETFHAKFDARLSGLVATLRTLGRAVYLVEDAPEADFDVPLALTQEDRFGTVPRVAPSLDDYLQRQRFVFRVFSELSARYGAKRISLAPALCDAKNCRVVARGQPLYIDNDHLSRTGSALVSCAFDPVFEKAGQNPAPCTR